MVLRTLKLQNFRNLSGEYTLSNGINIIVGKNGLGKTNFIESIHFLSNGKSFRTNSDLYAIKRSLIELDEIAFARVEGIIMDSLGSEQTKDVYLEKSNNGNGVKKVLKINSKKVSQANFLHVFYSIVFSPNSIDLVISSPFERRKDLDDFLCVFNDSYSKILFDYRRVVRNRNKLFEKISMQKGKKEELNFWNNELIHLAPIIIYERIKMIKRINKVIKRIGPDMFNLDLEDLDIFYDSKFAQHSSEFNDIEAKFREKVSDNIHKEIRACTTLYGPQREDFHFNLNSNDLKEMGSRGQQRLFSFLYKMAQWKILKEKIEYPPILLLDDIFSELDDKVQKNVCKFLSKIDVQIIITTTNIDGFSDKFIKRLHKIQL